MTGKHKASGSTGKPALATSTRVGGTKLVSDDPTVWEDYWDSPYLAYAFLSPGPVDHPTVPNDLIGSPMFMSLLTTFVYWTGGGWTGLPGTESPIIGATIANDTIPVAALDTETKGYLIKANNSVQIGAAGVVTKTMLSTEVQATLDSVGSSSAQKWSSEFLVCPSDTPRAQGYMDNIGGVTVDAPILLEKVAFRLPNPTATVGGTGVMQLSVDLGTATTYGSPVVSAYQVNAGNNADLGVYTLPTPVACAEGTVLRTNITPYQTTGNGLQVQYRGRYA